MIIVAEETCATHGKKECDPVATCIDLANGGFTCRCPPDFMDKSPDPSKPGRKCDGELSQKREQTHIAF